MTSELVKKVPTKMESYMSLGGTLTPVKDTKLSPIINHKFEVGRI